MITEIFIIILLILLNSFFALCEFAIVSANKYVIQQLYQEGNNRAKSALLLIDNQPKFLSTIQIGITLIGILAGAYGGSTIGEKIGDYLNQIPLLNPNGELIAVIPVVIIITYFSIVIGELLPKQIALSNPDRIAIAIAPIMLSIANYFSPIVKILELSSNKLLTLFGIKKISSKKITDIELKAIIEESVESGAIENEEKEMMNRIISIGDRSIKTIMTHKSEINFFYIDENHESIQNIIHLNTHSRYPVINKYSNEIEGIIEVKDIIVNALAGERFELKNYLKKPTILPESANCLQALKIFKTSMAHMIIVINEYGDLQGIVTLSDIVEAIVGIISSNYNSNKKPHILKKDLNIWLVDGITSTSEIALELGIEEIIDYHEFDTVAGFIHHFLKTEPREGESIKMFGYNFEIIDMDSYRIDKILIKKI